MNAVLESLEDYRGEYRALATAQCCWTCGWHRLGGSTFLGACGWFEAHQRPRKDIAPSMVDVGCRFWAVQPEPQTLRLFGEGAP